LETTNAAGIGFTTTVADPEITFVHVPFVADTKFNIAFVVTPVAVTSTVPFEPIVAVAEVPPLKLYVIISPAVPVIVNCAFCVAQIGVVTGAAVADKSGG
jgi:hypothetical protein